MEFTHSVPAVTLPFQAQAPNRVLAVYRKCAPEILGLPCLYTASVYIFFFFNCIFVFKSAVLFEYIIWNEEAFLLIQKTIQAIIKSLFKFKFRTSLFLNCLPAFWLLTQQTNTTHSHMKLKGWKSISQFQEVH